MSDLICWYGHSVPTGEAVDRVAALGPVIELGAGAGYWARLLRDRGADVVAYDENPTGTNSWIADAPLWTDIRQGDETAITGHRDRTLFVSWPPRPSGFLTTVLDRWPPPVLVLVTDGRVQADLDDPLYGRLAADWRDVDRVELPQWPYRRDALTIWRPR